MSVPIPIERVKNACPIALSHTSVVIFEKSGLKRKMSPLEAFGSDKEHIASTISNRKSMGIMIFEPRSMPFCTPNSTIPVVMMMNAMSESVGFTGSEMNIPNDAPPS